MYCSGKRNISFKKQPAGSNLRRINRTLNLSGAKGSGLITVRLNRSGRLPKWPTGADCKSAGLRLRWFESITYHHFKNLHETLLLPFILKGFINIADFGL